MILLTAMGVSLAAALSAQSAGISEHEEERSRRITRAFNELSIDTFAILDDFYAENVEFADPLVVVHGLADLRAYYSKMYRRVEEISFEIHEEVAQDDTHVVTWTMRFRAKKMNRGNEILVDGNSIIRFRDDNKVIYHRDYFDMDQLVYRHIPVLKLLTGFINNRIKRT